MTAKEALSIESATKICKFLSGLLAASPNWDKLNASKDYGISIKDIDDKIVIEIYPYQLKLKFDA